MERFVKIQRNKETQAGGLETIFLRRNWDHFHDSSHSFPHICFQTVIEYLESYIKVRTIFVFFRLSTLGGGGGDDGKEKQHIIEEEFLGWFLGAMCALEDTLASWYNSNIEDTLFVAQENCYTASHFLYRLTHPPPLTNSVKLPLWSGQQGWNPPPFLLLLTNCKKLQKQNILIHFFCAEDVKKTSVSASVDITILSI